MAWVLAAALVVGGSLAAWALTVGSEPESTQAEAPAQPEPAPAGTADDSAAPTDDAQPAAPAALDVCTEAAASGDAAVAAAAVSARQWKAHYSAQLGFDSGDLTSEEAKAQWAASKVDGDVNLAAYRDAVAAFTERDACRNAVLAGGDPAAVAVATACQARVEAAARAVLAADTSLQGWAAHLEQMANKASMDSVAYLSQWQEFVAAAPAPMTAFEEALADHERAPSCEA